MAPGYPTAIRRCNLAKKRILVLAANPKDTSRLRLDEEVREVDSGLQRSRNRDEFVLKQQWATRPQDIRRAMLDFQPQIVHFCGHGSGDAGIAFEDESGLTRLVSSDALADFFELFSEDVECVVLNACYSEKQARAIAKHIDYVVGMKQGIEDKAAIEFAVAFYDALGAGRSIEFAYRLGCSAIKLIGMPGHLNPILIAKIGNDNALVEIETDTQPKNGDQVQDDSKHDSQTQNRQASTTIVNAPQDATPDVISSYRKEILVEAFSIRFVCKEFNCISEIPMHLRQAYPLIFSARSLKFEGSALEIR
jgi:hypothetical protein